MNRPVKLFFDTEFTDLKKDCDLISIGVVADIGETNEGGGPDCPVFYAENLDFAPEKCSDFVRENVLPNLVMNQEPRVVTSNGAPENKSKYNCYAICGTLDHIADQFKTWLGQFGDVDEKNWVEMWSDCLAYDWVLFCDMFGDEGIPNCVNYIPFDISTYMKVDGVDPDITREDFVRDHYNDQLEENWDVMSKHNSLFDAMVIYYCHKELELRRKGE